MNFFIFMPFELLANLYSVDLVIDPSSCSLSAPFQSFIFLESSQLFWIRHHTFRNYMYVARKYICYSGSVSKLTTSLLAAPDVTVFGEVPLGAEVDMSLDYRP